MSVLSSKNKIFWTLAAFLVLQAVLFAAASRREVTRLSRPLAEFPLQVGDWRMIQQGVTDPETMAVLRADEVLNRTYGRSGGIANLFVAFFASQRSGQAPHSPKNCLPGSGWVQEQSDIINIPVEGGANIQANRYVVARGDNRSLVLYWYQSHGRTVASEYRAKIYVVADAIRYNRTDTALVRVVVAMPENNLEKASRQAIEMAQNTYPLLRKFLPE